MQAGQAERAQTIAELLDSKKAEEVAIFDLRESDYFVDYVVIATSMADKHGQSLLDTMRKELKPKGEEFLQVEEGDEWIVVDLGDILVHIMSENARMRFQLEEFLGKKEEERRKKAEESAGS